MSFSYFAVKAFSNLTECNPMKEATMVAKNCNIANVFLVKKLSLLLEFEDSLSAKLLFFPMEENQP
jgi:hypothetical protein